jgi:ATP-dependent Clp protease ATP-binding subunit ClpX
MEGVDEVRIDKDVVAGSKEPIRVFAKKPAKEKAAGDAA